MLAALVLGATATLIVPWFEVSIEPDNRNFDSRIHIVNTSQERQKARINVWTDLAHPVLYYTTPIEPGASKTISLRELIVDGVADICASPGQRVPGPMLQMMQCALTTGCRQDFTQQTADCNKPVGERHAHAIGFVTIDLVDDCMDLTSPDLPEYAMKVRSETVLTGSVDHFAHGRIHTSEPLQDRASGPLPRFQKPRTPRDPKARKPAKQCPPPNFSGPVH